MTRSFTSVTPIGHRNGYPVAPPITPPWLLFLAVSLLVSYSTALAEPFRSSHECRVCHKEIYKEWALSKHAHSWSNPAFQERYQRMSHPKECVACHASKPVNETGLCNKPVARQRNRADGISCITCHSQGPIIHGPRGIKRTGLSCGNKAHKTPMICAPCHSNSCRCFTRFKGLHNRQVGEWAQSPYRFTVSCQGCHMPKRVARVANMRVPELPARTLHQHTFPGADDADFIRRAIEFKIERQSDELLLSIVNANAGHSLPASEGRSLIIRLSFLDDSNLELEHRVECIEAAQRTRIRAGGSRVYSYLLQEGFRRVKISIMFRHYPEQPERHWILLHHRIFDLQREFETPPTSHIGDKLRARHKYRERLKEQLKKPVQVDEWGRRRENN